MRGLLLVCVATVAAFAAPVLAHFPFIVPGPTGTTARLVMSETLSPDLDVGIDIVSGAKLWMRTADGRETPLTLEKAADHMSLVLPGAGTRVVRGVVDLGVMQRGKPHLLIYHPKTILGDAFDTSTTLGKTVPVELIPIKAGGGFKLKLVIDGKAAAGKDVRVLTPDGEQADHATDADGCTRVFAEPGRYGAWARAWLDQTGDRDGKSYEQVRHYATLVFDSGASEAPAAPSIATRTPLPRAIASFGAIESDGWLYVYGGHTAERHEYSTATVSGQFHRLSLRDPGRWEELPGGVAVQGLNLAAHGGKVYRVGGMEPRNPPGQPSDSYSIADAAAFDPATGRWDKLPPLPTPRSSHDVLVVDQKLFVIGGWWMKGKEQETQWPDTIDVLDLAASEPAWQSIPQPFARRALITAALGGRIYIIGGFDADETACLDVDIYDVATNSWSKGPPIPGKKRNGFAPAACMHHGSVYLSVSTGEMFRLIADGSAWEPVVKTTPRIVHRLVPFKNEILVIGGAAEAKMVDLIEAVKVGE
jgi:hypothetical protein